MPYALSATYWDPDFVLFSGMPGGQKLSEWFGFVTDFHDAKLVAIDLLGSTAKVTIEAFRMTSKVNSDGFYVLDRHATVTMTLTGVRHAAITSEMPTTVMELGVRHVAVGAEGEVVIGFDDVMGEGGSIIATGVEIDFVPAVVLPDGESS